MNDWTPESFLKFAASEMSEDDWRLVGADNLEKRDALIQIGYPVASRIRGSWTRYRFLSAKLGGAKSKKEASGLKSMHETISRASQELADAVISLPPQERRYLQRQVFGWEHEGEKVRLGVEAFFQHLERINVIGRQGAELFADTEARWGKGDRNARAHELARWCAEVWTISRGERPGWGEVEAYKRLYRFAKAATGVFDAVGVQADPKKPCVDAIDALFRESSNGKSEGEDLIARHRAFFAKLTTGQLG